MAKHRSSSSSSAGNRPGRRAWRLLRLALLWARKGGLLKCRLMAELRHGAKYLKAGVLNHHKHHSKDMIKYGERELSFDETPIIHLKMSRPASLRFMIPCIKPDVVDFDYDFGVDDDGFDGVGARRSFLGYEAEDRDDHDQGEDQIGGDDDQGMMSVMMMGYEDEGIDDKAEEFIAKFYKQMKLQREISFQRRRINANSSSHSAIEVA